MSVDRAQRLRYFSQEFLRIFSDLSLALPLRGLEQAMVHAVLALVLCIGASIRTHRESKCPLYAGFFYLFYQPVCQAVFQCRLNHPQLQHTYFR